MKGNKTFFVDLAWRQCQFSSADTVAGCEYVGIRYSVTRLSDINIVAHHELSWPQAISSN